MNPVKNSNTDLKNFIPVKTKVRENFVSIYVFKVTVLKKKCVMHKLLKNTHIYFSHIGTPGAPKKMEALPGKLVIVNYMYWLLQLQTKTCRMADRLLRLRPKKGKR